MKNSLIILGIVMSVAAAGFIAYNITAPKTKPGTVASSNGSMSIQSPKPGTIITVDSINMQESGFVIVSKDDGERNIIGVSTPLSRGENKNINISLTEEVKDGQIIYISVHVDGNGDRVFEFPGGPDIWAYDASGKKILARMNVAGSLQAETVSTVDNSAGNIVAYHNGGFFPDKITIKAGQYVTFENVSDNDMWIASDPHPSHSALMGFDEHNSVKTGGRYSHVFTQTGAWKYHNEMDLSKNGTVIVE
ncbi:MAG: hypothetical protein WC835_02235 [Candidatus Paceibacterota bacterium]|jgi:plastocyanin